MSIKPTKIALLGLSTLALALMTARAELFSLSVSGTISFNSSPDTTIPVGTPWAFELIYDTDAPDQDVFADPTNPTPDPTSGVFTNDGEPPALLFFHYRAGAYEVTIDDPDDFGLFPDIRITFLPGVHAIDINIRDTSPFPLLAGRPVSFHADFNDFGFSTPTLTSDGLPTDPSIGVGNFQGSDVTLLLQGGGAIVGSQQDLITFVIAPVPEPSTCALAIIGITALLYRRPRSAERLNGMNASARLFRNPQN